MSDIIKIEEKQIGLNSLKTVSARELYEKLGLDKSHINRWLKKNIVENTFVAENEDWIGFALMANGNQITDYAITIKFAKHLCMMAKTENGHKIREYFIQCENQLKQSIASYMIQDPIERAKKWIEEQEEHRRIEQEQQKTIDNYKLATEKKIEKQKLFSEINRLIRKKAYDNFDGVFEDLYRYYYKELANRHNFIHKVDMTFLKQHKEYAQELLEMLL